MRTMKPVCISNESDQRFFFRQPGRGIKWNAYDAQHFQQSPASGVSLAYGKKSIHFAAVRWHPLSYEMCCKHIPYIRFHFALSTVNSDILLGEREKSFAPCICRYKFCTYRNMKGSEDIWKWWVGVMKIAQLPPPPPGNLLIHNSVCYPTLIMLFKCHRFYVHRHQNLSIVSDAVRSYVHIPSTARESRTP